MLENLELHLISPRPTVVGASLLYFRYKVSKQLGDGTYGSVWKATNMQTKEPVSTSTAAARLYCSNTCINRPYDLLHHRCVDGATALIHVCVDLSEMWQSMLA